MFDKIFSIFAIILISPIIIIVSSIIILKDGFPIFFSQERVGKNGKIFKIYKFRTMIKNAEEILKNDKSLYEEYVNNGYKIESSRDPRILPFGKFLRSSSIDELPQFFNVLKGEMSIVGPRPLFDEDTKLFNESYMRRLNVLPGITGLLQINERNTSEFETWYKYDIEYIESWSLYLDLKIIFKTPLSLFKSKVKGL